VLVLVVGMLASTTVLLLNARKMWFFGDEWAFIYHRALTGGDGPGIFEPHNEHWSTIPLVLYRVMWHVVGLQHYPIWVLMPVLTLMVGAAAMFVLLRRAGGSDWTAVICAVVLAWNGSGEDTLWAFQVGFLGSMTAGILACLAYQEMESRRGLVLANVFGVVALMCSGLGVPMVAWVSLFALMLRGWRAALSVGVVPTLVYGLWYVTYGVDGVDQTQGLPDPGPAAFLNYVWTGIGHVWDVTTGASGIGVLVFMGLAAVAIFAPATPKQHALAVSGVVTTVFAYTMLAVSRASFGPEQATALRYVPLGLILTLPAFAIVVGLLGAKLPGRSVERVVVAVGLTALLVATSYASTRNFAIGRGAIVAGLEQRVLTGVYLVEHGEPLMRGSVEAIQQPPIDVVKLASPGQRDHVPEVQPDDEELWTARAQFRIGATPTPAALPFARSVTGLGLGGDLDLSSCEEDATNILPLGYVEVPPGPRGAQVGLRTPGTSVSVQLVHDGEVSEPAILTTAPGQTLFVGTNVPDAAVRITLTTDTFGICDHG
jgi:hypothetical protein